MKSTGTRNVLLVLVSTLAAAAWIACSDASEAPPTAPPPPKPLAPAPEPVVADPVVTGDAAAGEKPAAATGDAAAGEKHYAAFCASCHGPRGDGDGPIGAALTPKPAKHSDGAYMNVLSDEYLFKVIKEGGIPVGKSPLMAPWGGSLSDEQILDVVAFIRTLADPPYEP